MADAEEKQIFELYRSYLREHVGQIRAAKAPAVPNRQLVVPASADRRLKPQSLLLMTDGQHTGREETYPSTHTDFIGFFN